MGCLSSKEYTGEIALGEYETDHPKTKHPDIKKGKGVTFIALYDYDARTEFDLGFKKNDKLLVIDQGNSDWWVAKLDGRTGYVPANFLVEEGNDLGPWYHADCSRRDAERLLTDAAIGTFLVRPRETNANEVQGYSLSVRALTPGENNTNFHDIRHYKIQVRIVDHKTQCFISDKLVFESLDKLISHYKEQQDGLCMKLGEPCPRPGPRLTDLSPETADKWEIPREDIEFISLLGSGQFGEVWSAWYRKKSKVAVKTMKPGTMKPEAFLLEAKLMKKLQHKHLVRLYAVCTKEEPLYIVTELVGKGCLLKFLRDGDGKDFDNSRLIGLSADVASAMVYLESLNFIHRDLAARNVLVDNNYSCKVCDFGLARCLTENTYQASRGTKFPIKWTAPEAASFGHFTIKSDVWSFGILMYEVVTRGKVPYPGMNNREVLEQVENGYRMPMPDGCPEPFYKLMRNCWNSEANKRPTFEYLFRALSEFTINTEKAYEG